MVALASDFTLRVDSPVQELVHCGVQFKGRDALLLELKDFSEEGARCKVVVQQDSLVDLVRSKLPRCEPRADPDTA